jgi:tRNA threonylcarbamoyl adenosine modification protein YjeE
VHQHESTIPAGTALRLRSQAETERLAEAVAASARGGDSILLSGDLGAGKSTFARALIRAVADQPRLEVPSPTFTLVQDYDLPRLRVLHLDLYRIDDPREVDELGIEDTAQTALVVVEWPERAPGRFTGNVLEVWLALDPAAPEERTVRMRGDGSWAERLARLLDVREAIAAMGFAHWSRSFLQGDASSRRYERLSRGGETVILMDSPARPDPGIGEVPYSRVAHLAESVTPFVAMAIALRERGFSAPAILGSDLAAGVLVTEDLGREGILTAEGRPVEERYAAAIDLLSALHDMSLPDLLEVPGAQPYRVPAYDHSAMLVEVSLLLDWYAPLATGGRLPQRAVTQFREIWDDLLFELDDPFAPPVWVLRDYHSPNLMWLPQRQGIARIGILDMQDAVMGPPAYDVASLVFDARVDIPDRMWRELYSRYVADRQVGDPAFDAEGFDKRFSILAAQRNTKILGIFARLAERDGKRGYLRHIPRIRGYLAHALAHPVLGALRVWYETHLPDRDHRIPGT